MDTRELPGMCSLGRRDLVAKQSVLGLPQSFTPLLNVVKIKDVPITH